MAEKKNRVPETAKNEMDEFLLRTGISDPSGDIRQRYLWTDAFAVQACFALAHLTGNDKYREDAINLIDNVHFILGKHRADDPRNGWLSGMDEEEGARHPTAGGLRIGKKLPSRLPDEPFDQMLEWERDGQYFHYLTRWFHALMETFAETGDKRYAQQAAELILAGRKFIHQQNGRIRMF